MTNFAFSGCNIFIIRIKIFLGSLLYLFYQVGLHHLGCSSGSPIWIYIYKLTSSCCKALVHPFSWVLKDCSLFLFFFSPPVHKPSCCSSLYWLSLYSPPATFSQIFCLYSVCLFSSPPCASHFSLSSLWWSHWNIFVPIKSCTATAPLRTNPKYPSSPFFPQTLWSPTDEKLLPPPKCTAGFTPLSFFSRVPATNSFYIIYFLLWLQTIDFTCI